LGVGAAFHFGHIGLIVLTDVLKTGKDQILMAEDGIIAEIAVMDGLQHLRPRRTVEGFVFFDLIMLQPTQLAEYLFGHGMTSCSVVGLRFYSIIDLGKMRGECANCQSFAGGYDLLPNDAVSAYRSPKSSKGSPKGAFQ
jgi:hypothetical protein